MKTILLILFTSFSMILTACNNSDLDKSKELVSEYIKSNTNDAGSYEPIEFGELEKSEVNVYKYKIRHKFRANNVFGGKVINEEYFYITDDLKFAEPLNKN